MIMELEMVNMGKWGGEDLTEKHFTALSQSTPLRPEHSNECMLPLEKHCHLEGWICKY
jgi:hypothetical protein